MAYVVLTICAVSLLLWGVATLRFLPSRLHIFNVMLPKGRIARTLLMPFFPPGGQYDSLENLVHVRRAGFLSIFMGLLVLVAMVWIAR
jgi:hypothetical protein